MAHWKIIVSLVNVLCLFQSVTGIAPGDEDRLCLNLASTPPDNQVQVLLDSYNYINLLTGVFPPPVWRATKSQPGHDGWTMDESRHQICRSSVHTCDYEHGQVNNWLFTQFIQFDDAKEVFVEVTFNFTDCLDTPCTKRYIDLFYHSANQSNPSEQTAASNYHSLGQLEHPASSRIEQTSMLSLKRPNSLGFYLGLRDTGTCGTINRLKVYYKVCPSKIDGLTTYPSLPLPPQTSSQPNVAYAYCAANSVNSVASGYRASGDGMCVYGAECQCRVGYEQVTTTTPHYVTARCRVCPQRTYRSESDTSCQTCPANTFTTGVGVSVCPCVVGYYRTANEGPNAACTSPPSPCQNIVVDPTSTHNKITVKWNRPAVTGRNDFYYNVWYKTSYGSFIKHNRYPYVVSTNDVSYTIAGLAAFKNYIIRVTVHNGVSDQDEAGKQNRLCEISTTTIPNQLGILDIVSGVAIWNATDNSGLQFRIQFNRTQQPSGVVDKPLSVHYVVDETSTYDVEVQALSGNNKPHGLSEQLSIQFSKGTMPTTTVPGKMTIFGVLNGVVVWNSPDPADNVTGYLIRYQVNGAKLPVEITLNNVEQNFFYIRDLKINTTRSYSIQIQLLNNFGSGEWSEPFPTLLDSGEIYFELKGERYSNWSTINLTDVGENEDALQCVTNNPQCCYPYSIYRYRRNDTRYYHGEFYFPSGAQLKHRSDSINNQIGIYRSRGTYDPSFPSSYDEGPVVHLNRRNDATLYSPTGVYRCEIPNVNGIFRSLYVALV